MKPNGIYFLIVLLLLQVLRTQAQTPAKPVALADSTIGILCTNAQGEEGILYNKTGGPEFHRLDNNRPVAALELKAAVTKRAAANTISTASKAPAPASAMTNKNAAASAKPSFRIINRDTISAPPQLEGNH
jgi:hypothetical protein